MRYVAADFGAGSGRVIVGSFENEELVLDEIHRFPNRQITLNGRVYWDFLSLFEELKSGLRKAFAKYGDEIYSIGVDTWGVDFGLIDGNGHLLANPVCYRDSRTKGMLEEAFERLPKEDFFALASNQFMEINTAFQLLSATLTKDVALKNAKKLLFMPDLFNYFLTGKTFNEYTISSTSQLLNSQTKKWDKTIFSALDLDRDLMQKIIFPQTVIGDLTAEICAEVGGNAKVVAVGSHDTASALASIRTNENDWAFISSGTWSLMGVKVDEPIQTPEAMDSNFTNEGTVDGKIRFLKNITGLWLIQSLVKEWEKQGQQCDYSVLVSEAENSTCNSVVDVDDVHFANPISMSKAIGDFCERTNQEKPVTNGDFMRCVCLSLATKYAEVKQQLEDCSGKEINKIYIVGGGSRNRLLNKFTEEKTGCKVILGDVEATAIGNITIQALSSGELK